jgi:aquaporin Z
MRRYVMEFVGTFFLVTAIGFSGDPLAIGLMLAVMVYMGGHVSGAHYNPAVSLAIHMRGKLSTGDTLRYWAAQFLGALAAASLYLAVMSKSFAPNPDPNVDKWKVIVLEALFTFALASVVLNVATTKALAGNYIYGLAIGLTVTAGALSVGSLTGGAFNPSVSVGPYIVKAVHGTTAWSSAGRDMGFHLVGTFLGGAIAGLAFKFFNPDEVAAKV